MSARAEVALGYSVLRTSKEVEEKTRIRRTRGAKFQIASLILHTARLLVGLTRCLQDKK